MFAQGAKVKSNLPPTRPPLPTREELDSIHFNAKHGCYVMAMANQKKPWARRWLRANGHMY